MEVSATKRSSPNGEPPSSDFISPEKIPSAVEDVLTSTDFIDIHTHLFAPEFGKMGLSGIDELVTYHMLAQEARNMKLDVSDAIESTDSHKSLLTACLSFFLTHEALSLNPRSE